MSESIKIYKAYQTKNPCYKRGRPMKPINILVHSTGAPNTYMRRYVDAPEILGKNRYNNHWNKPEAKKCMHAFVGKDINGELAVVQTLPYDMASWGCGSGSKGSYNRDPVGHIQFEICEDSRKNADYYWAVFEVAEKYCVWLCKQFDFDPMGITSHVEAAKLGYASNHADPVHWMKVFGDSMDKFRQRVAARLKQELAEEQQEQTQTAGPDDAEKTIADLRAENADLRRLLLNTADSLSECIQQQETALEALKTAYKKVSEVV